MLLDEASWFGARLPKSPESTGVVLNIASSTREFRTVRQPYIQEKIVAPLENRGFKVIHVDRKQADGVDVVGELNDPEFLDRLSEFEAEHVFCNGLLMHLDKEDRERLIPAMDKMLNKGGALYLSTSTRYPYTADPYDSYYRPDDRDLAALFPSYELVDSTIIETAGSFLDQLRRRKIYALALAARALMPFYKPRSWYFLMRYLPHLNKPFQTACVILRKA
jgi:hypothetical protein